MKNKKFFDYLLSIPAAIVVMPVMAVIAVWIKLDSPGPVFFKQTRIGIHKTQFEILKFRTMRTDTPKDTPTHLLKNPEQYITKSGKFLRKTSLDELPQLINILKGDMSIVGPRPALWNQYDLIAERDKYGANDVLPGLTGWAQIHGRDTISIQEKAKLDGYYVQNRSLWLDIKCILLTAISVLKHEGVQEGGTGARSESGKNAERKEADKKPEAPLVSVVIATYRRKKELERALASLASQTYKNMEVILVDDNADSAWCTEVKTLVAKWKRKSSIPLCYIQNSENCGSAASRNIGIQAANGQYITFLDDDDKYSPEKISHQIHHMLEEESDFSITDLALYNEDGKLEEKRVRNFLNRETISEPSRLLAYHLMYHLTGTDTLMFKKEYLEEIGGFPPIDVGDEFYLMKEAITYGGKFSYLPVCDVKALVHSKTDGLSSRESKIAGENALYEYKKQFFSSLSEKEVRQIRMRHNLVLAYAHLRERKHLKFLRYAMRSMAEEPVSCMKILLGYINGK